MSGLVGLCPSPGGARNLCMTTLAHASVWRAQHLAHLHNTTSFSTLALGHLPRTHTQRSSSSFFALSPGILKTVNRGVITDLTNGNNWRHDGSHWRQRLHEQERSTKLDSEECRKTSLKGCYSIKLCTCVGKLGGMSVFWYLCKSIFLVGVYMYRYACVWLDQSSEYKYVDRWIGMCIHCVSWMFVSLHMFA